MNISCLPAERKQKGAKQRVHCVRQFHKTLLTQEVYATMQNLKVNRVFQKERLGTPETPVAAGDMEWEMLAGSGFAPPRVKARSAQCGNIHLHTLDLLLWREDQEHLVGSAACFIQDLFMNHVVMVLMYTRVGNALSPVGARLVTVPLARVYAPLAYTKLEDNKVLALPPAWL